MTQPAVNFELLILSARIADVFMQSHRVAFAQLSPALRVTHVSPNIHALLLDDTQALLGCHVTELFWEFVGAEEDLRAVLRGDTPHYALTQINRDQPDGTTLYLNLEVIPFDENQPPQGLLLIVEDATATNRLLHNLLQSRNDLRLTQSALAQANETLTQLSRFKSFMLAMAAHDLRSPLTAISGYAELLLAEGVSIGAAEKRTFTSAIKTQANHIDQMISDLLDFDQIEQGRLTLELLPCDLNELVLAALRPLKALADLRQQTFQLALLSTPIPIQAEPRRFHQVAQNLIGNAIKYSPKGGCIEIATRIEGSDALVSITDSGAGLSSDEQARVFQPYYRTESVQYSQVAGAGLGLYIAKLLIDRHNGHIAVASQLGQGTTFSVRLPLRVS